VENIFSRNNYLIFSLYTDNICAYSSARASVTSSLTSFLCIFRLEMISMCATVRCEVRTTYVRVVLFLCFLLNAFSYQYQNKTGRVRTEVLFHNYCCRGKAISITYSKCMFVAVVSVIQHMKPMRHIILSSVAYPVIQYFSTLSHKRTIFVRKKLLNLKRVLTFFTTFVRRIYLFSEELSDCYHKCIYVFVQSTIYSCQMSLNPEFCGHIFENSNIKFRENPWSGSRVVPFVRADGRRDRRT
jgi:hypothetical protein